MVDAVAVDVVELRGMRRGSVDEGSGAGRGFLAEEEKGAAGAELFTRNDAVSAPGFR